MRRIVMKEEININEAYLAMYAFLEELYVKYGFDQFGGLLGSMSLLSDGSTADPAIWEDWIQCVQRVKGGDVDASLRFKEKD